MLNQLSENNLTLPTRYPEKWVVDCKSVGKGEKALIYLGRYLYRGKDIIACGDNESVTYRYRESKTGTWKTKTLAGADFLWRLMRHVLPKGFRRARNFGFLHPNSKRLIQVLQLKFNIDPNRFTRGTRERPKIICPCCGENMAFTGFRISPTLARRWPTRSILGEAIG